MEILKITKINEVYLKIDCPESVKRELWEHFSFFASNYKWNPKFKMRLWDGRIRLFDIRKGTLYVGLMKKVALFCKERGYSIECSFSPDVAFSENEFDDILKELNLNKTPRDYQRKAIIKAIRKQRATFLSPTASGKSFIIYLILRILNMRSLLIVPSTQLCLQMQNDFKEYSEDDPLWDVDTHTSIIMGGRSKENLNEITISTWQSLQDMPKSYFDEQDFQCVILDEAHGGKAAKIKYIMENIERAIYRIGLTGTLDDTEMSELTITGLFGPIYPIVETSELIENGTLSELDIKCITFEYDEEIRKALHKEMKLATGATGRYNMEIDFIIKNERRNKFIKNLALSLKGNTLVLFGRVDDHGKKLAELIADNNKGKQVFYISGEVPTEVREKIRKTVEEEKKDCIIVASVGTFATGVNIVNLHNIIHTHPTKAKIKLLQGIGRGLRKDETGICYYYDLSDDLSYKSNKNYTLVHFIERLKIFMKSGFKYKTYKVQL